MLYLMSYFSLAEKVGIEPTTYRLDSFAVSIPKLVLREGIEPPSTVCNTVALPLDERSIKLWSPQDSNLDLLLTMQNEKKLLSVSLAG